MASPFRYNRLSVIQRRLAKDAVEFCLDKFCPRMKDRMIVRVVGKEDHLERYHLYAECEYVDDDVNCREFTIYIDTTLDLLTFLETMMHEMVHVKQFAKGEMKDYTRNPSLIRWKKEQIDIENTDYWDLPWEIEAHGREKGLTIQFKRQYLEWALVLLNEEL